MLDDSDIGDWCVKMEVLRPEEGNLSNPTAGLDLHGGDQARFIFLSKPRVAICLNSASVNEGMSFVSSRKLGIVRAENGFFRSNSNSRMATENIAEIVLRYLFTDAVFNPR